MRGATAVDPRAEARFTALYRDNYDRVLRFVLRRVGERGSAEDITAEVFRIAWARAGEASITPGWLFVTAQNLLKNHYRAAQRLEQVLAAAREELARPDHEPSAVDAVRATLSDLDEQHRLVLVLSYWDGLSAREIADVVGISAAAVWTRLHRARRAFRDVFDGRTR